MYYTVAVLMQAVGPCPVSQNFESAVQHTITCARCVLCMCVCLFVYACGFVYAHMCVCVCVCVCVLCIDVCDGCVYVCIHVGV